MRRSSSTPLIPSPLVPSIRLLLIAIAISGGQWQQRSFVTANFHTEGGNFKLPSTASNDHSSGRQAANQPNEQYYDVELASADDALNSAVGDRYLSSPGVYEQQQRQPMDSSLEGIVEELNKQLRRESEAYDESQSNSDVEGIPTMEVDSKPSRVHSSFRQRQREQEQKLGNVNGEIEELRRLGHKFKELAQVKQAQSSSGAPEEVDSSVKTNEEASVEKPAKIEKETEKKRGQSEYVEFIEPVHAKKLKNQEYLEKRLAAEDERMPSHSHHYRAFNLISTSGNIAFIAFITLCCVFSIVGVVGGMYYYNRVRAHREDPFDDFTRYSPAGPGRDKLKKGRAGSPNAFGGEKGDESLAYKAQLHHYQQTKQKIIGEQAGVGGGDMDASDRSDDEGDLEHNFSVYECPGLAPTGDIEVQNPNFVESPHSGKQPTILSTH